MIKNKLKTITLTEEEWAGVTTAFVSRLQELEQRGRDLGYLSDSEQEVIDWTRKLFRKIHQKITGESL